MNDLVAATLRSGPARNGNTASAMRARGEVSSLTRATTKAPASAAAWAAASRSGLRPDWEITRQSVPFMSGAAS